MSKMLPESRGTSKRSVKIKTAGVRVHQAVPDQRTDWLTVIDQIREERAQAVLGLDCPEEPG